MKPLIPRRIEILLHKVTLKQSLGHVPPDRPWHLFRNKKLCLDKLASSLSLRASRLPLFRTLFRVAVIHKGAQTLLS